MLVSLANQICPKGEKNGQQNKNKNFGTQFQHNGRYACQK